MKALKMKICFEDDVIIWDDISVPMKDPATFHDSESVYAIFAETQEPESTKTSTK